MYDVLYRRGAPWEGGPREELVALVQSGALTPRSPGPRALDVGCGSGANAVFLAANGFEVTGIDFSAVALRKAHAAAEAAGVRVEWVEADLLETPAITGAFDLVVDYGTLDDLHGSRRRALASAVSRWTRTDGQFLLWCFYGDVAWWRRRGARVPGGLRDGEERVLFGEAFEVVRLPRPERGSGFACFVMRRR
jgi:cyclopropane fatty-acyl-phospholipid synthase-like methyltransferase